MARNIDTNLLRAFVAVAETAGMTAAANVLNLTQAAVSMQIKRLEESFDERLFERDRRGLRLTGAGERLFGKAKRLLALNDEIWTEMTTPLHTGEIKLGLPYDLVGPYLPSILRTFRDAFPKVQISLVCESSMALREAVKSGLVDLAVVEEPGPSPGNETLAVDPLRWVGARGGEAYRARPLPVALGSETCIFRPAIAEVLAGAEISWWPLLQISNTDALNATVESDLAIMALLDSTVPSQMEILGPESGLPMLPAFSINLHMPKSGGTPLARELARYVRAGFRTRLLQAA
jgi:DNA-binding transcriptional LysR family regulator